MSEASLECEGNHWPRRWRSAPGADNAEESRVLLRSPIHNFFIVADESTKSVGTSNVGLVQCDGKLYYEPVQ